MTLETQKWLILDEEVVGHGAMWIMADSTVFDHRIVLKDKGTLIPGVAAQTEVIHTFVGLDHTRKQVVSPMGLMAISTLHLAFPDWMVRRQITLGLDVLMTLAAELKLIGVGE